MSSHKLLKKARKMSLKKTKTKRLDLSIENIDIIEPIFLKSEFNQMPILINEMKKIQGEDFEISTFLKDFDEKIIKNSLWINGSDSDRRGLLSEYYVHLVLTVLKNKGLINDFFMTVRQGRLDHNNIDAKLVLVNGKHFFYPLQIKSSKYYQKKHIKKTTKTQKEISSVVATIDLRTLFQRILTIIKFYKKKNEVVHT